MDQVLHPYYYAQLNSREKAAYRAIKKATSRYEKTANFPHIEKHGVRRAFDALIFDNPLLYYISRSSYTYSTDYRNIDFNIKYIYDQKTIENYNKILMKKMHQMITLCRGKNDYEKELFVHDWLHRHITYDLNANQDSIHNIIGALVFGECVCDGFSYAFKILLNTLKIECIVVGGEAVSGKNDEPEGHAWNIVKLDGKYYNVDVTFDRLNSEKISSRSFLNIDDHEFRLTHMPQAEFHYPLCAHNRCPVPVFYKPNQLFGFLKSEHEHGAQYSEIKLPGQFEYERFKKHFEKHITPEEQWFHSIKGYIHGDYANSLFVVWR